MEGTMKCGIYYGVKNVGLEERPIPQIGPKDVLVKILRAGICGSDTGAYNHGGYPYGIFPGFQFGHEMVGRIVEKGEQVADDIQLDDIVFVEPLKAKRAGRLMADMCGGFSEYVNVENAVRNVNIYVLDKNVDLDAAALIEPVSVGTRGAVCQGVGADDNVVVLGAGTIGLGAAAGLVARGVKNVIVMDRNDWKLDIARQIGAKTVNSNTDDVTAKLLEYCGPAPTGAMDFSVVDPEILKVLAKLAESGMTNVGMQLPDVDLFVDAAGAPALLTKAFSLCRQGTKYTIVSVYGEDIPLPGSLFVSSEPVLTGSCGYQPETIVEVIDHIQNAKTPIKNIITRKFAHKDFAEAMYSASTKACKNIKVLIDYEM